MPANTWHLLPQAKAIIARCARHEFAEHRRPRIPVDEVYFAGLTRAAERRLDRLEALRREAIDNQLGYTFAQVAGSTERPQDFDEVRTRAWLAADREAPTVFDALSDAFAARAESKAEAA